MGCVAWVLHVCNGGLDSTPELNPMPQAGKGGIQFSRMYQIPPPCVQFEGCTSALFLRDSLAAQSIDTFGHFEVTRWNGKRYLKKNGEFI